MFESIKQKIANVVNNKVRGLPAIHDLWCQWQNFQALTSEDRRIYTARIDRFVDLYAALSASMQPVVLFTGTLFVPGQLYGQKETSEDPNEIAVGGYSWAEQAKEEANGRWIIDTQPYTTIKLASLKVLNGPYDVVMCLLHNVDLIATSKGRFPPGEAIGIPEKLAMISPAHRIKVVLEKRAIRV